MSVFPVRQYQPGGDFVVVRAMDYGPRHFEAGDLFPWREMGIHEATVQMLWKAVRIEVKREPVAPVAAVMLPSAPLPPPPPPPVAPPVSSPPPAQLSLSTPPAKPAPQHQNNRHNQHRR